MMQLQMEASRPPVGLTMVQVVQLYTSQAKPFSGIWDKLSERPAEGEIISFNPLEAIRAEAKAVGAKYEHANVLQLSLTKGTVAASLEADDKAAIRGLEAGPLNKAMTDLVQL